MSSVPLNTTPEYIMSRLIRLRETLSEFGINADYNALVLRTPEEYFLLAKYRADEVEKMRVRCGFTPTEDTKPPPFPKTV